jgi:hypothetical protein
MLQAPFGINTFVPHIATRIIASVDAVPANWTGALNVVTLTAAQVGHVGLSTDDGTILCCEPGLSNCTDPTSLIVGIGTGVRLWKAPFNADGVANLSSYDIVTVTERHSLLVILCSSNPQKVSFTGTAEFQNPYGYLPGVMYAYPVFYGTLMACHALLAIVFLVRTIRNRQWVLTLQLCILGVIGLGLVDVRCTNFVVVLLT